MSTINQRILAEHHETITSVIEAGSAVAVGTRTDSAALRRELTAALDNGGLRGPILELLGTAVDATTAELRGRPAPAPPYLTVTTRGPICRGTLSDGSRLVVGLYLFDVEREPRRYVFCEPTPETCLSVERR